MENTPSIPGQHPSSGTQLASLRHSFGARVAGVVAIIWICCYLLWGTEKGLAFNDWLNDCWIAITYHLLGFLGASVVYYDGILYGPQYKMLITGTCNGIFLWVLLATIVLFWPIRFSRRLAAAAIGIVVLIILNAIRLVSQFVVGSHSRAASDVLHDFVWPLFYCITSLLGVFYFAKAARPHRGESVGSSGPDNLVQSQP
jgi:exosortase/archaeosortase family protein